MNIALIDDEIAILEDVRKCVENEILPQEISRCFGVGAIHLDTKEICLFEENLGGFGLGDFYFDCNLKEQKHGDSRQMNLLIFYCPIRYKNES